VKLDLPAWYGNLSQRDHRVLTVGAVLAAAILVVGLVWQLQRSVDAARSSLDQQQRDLEFAQAGSAQILAAGPVRASSSNEPLVVLVDRAAREAGLAAALGASESAPDGSLRIRFNAASFDALITLVARLGQQHGITIAAASVEPAAETGMVNASLSLRSAAGPGAAR